MTAVNECTQGFGRRLHPLTMCEYDVDCTPVADLRTEADRAALEVALADLACGWLTCLRAGRDALLGEMPILAALHAEAPRFEETA